MKLNNKLFVAVALAITTASSYGQELDVNLQIRPRFEYRNGYKELMKDDLYPTSLVSQRSRMNFFYKQDKLKANVSFQNVRIWGDVATTSPSDKNGIALFESWLSYDFNESWSTKIGRQVLSYDNQRILGGIDWAQQGQSHDALLVSNKKNSYQFDLGAALNNNNEALYEVAYSTNYKNMQFAWLNKKFTNTSISLLAMNTGYQYENLVENKFQVAYLQTVGAYGKWSGTKFFGDLGLYLQTGEVALPNDKEAISAYYGGFNLGYKFTEAFKAEVGFEYLSGKDQDDSDSKFKSFTPLFGTNHGFNGFMDYFYVGNHKNSVGLQDVYAKFTLDKDKWQVALTPHLFYSAASLYNTTTFEKQDSYLGTEIDLTASYKIDKNFLISGGVSKLFASSSMEALKGGDKSNGNNWAWVMVSFNPQLFTYKNKD
ncbi:alginate export family protein [Flavobacterium ardleyense]|uniref:Alginate export family protein n=1 Tax=Flavobacterium ardleyense TaxID=2038737 RepID=A0ABW5Z6C1_9FLAO